MTRVTRAPIALKAAGASDSGLLRDVNEDRYYLDVNRGIFIVVDGVGGQAAGGKAADIALSMLRSGLAQEKGTIARRVREAITAANNEIHRVAASRSEWNGMACVLTAVVVEDGRAIAGHVGDTRLYKLRGGRIQKVTRDHSPVGEREDVGEISESEAMAHPRRHEVYRDVGSDPHLAADDEFVDVYDVAFEPDAALLLCSDGLTDLVPSSELLDVVTRFAGQPRAIVEQLIGLANQAGGKDNVTVVYVEGEQFADTGNRLATRAASSDSESEITRRRMDAASSPPDTDTVHAPGVRQKPAKSRAGLAIAAALTVLGAGTAYVTYPYWSVHIRGAVVLPPSTGPTIVVHPTESIAAALQRAEPGSQVIVEPGEYRERLVLKSGVFVLSRVARGATLRLPGGAPDSDSAVIATGVSGAALIGFRIVGDAATPLGTGVLVSDSDVWVIDVEISGAAHSAIDVRNQARINLIGSTLQGNPGAALTVAAGSAPRIRHNVFAENGTADAMAAPLLLAPNVDAQFSGNIFRGLNRNALAALSDPLRTQLLHQNLFVDLPEPRSAPTVPHGGRGR
jgi:serine/threonine protein phosphatase PrpC